MKNKYSMFLLFIACLFFVSKHDWTEATTIWLLGCAYLGLDKHD